MSATILTAIFYGAWCDLIDGKVYKPVLEFGIRSGGPTHVTTQDTYRPGDMVYARIIFQKQRNLTGLIQWQLIDHIIRQYPTREGSLPIGIFDHTVRVELIPIDAEPGEYWFCGTVKYPVNWLSTVSYPLWTNRFKVVR